MNKYFSIFFFVIILVSCGDNTSPVSPTVTPTPVEGNPTVPVYQQEETPQNLTRNFAEYNTPLNDITFINVSGTVTRRYTLETYPDGSSNVLIYDNGELSAITVMNSTGGMEGISYLGNGLTLWYDTPYHGPQNTFTLGSLYSITYSGIIEDTYYGELLGFFSAYEEYTIIETDMSGYTDCLQLDSYTWLATDTGDTYTQTMLVLCRDEGMVKITDGEDTWVRLR